MLIKNLKLSFDRQSDGQLVFKTESGSEISLSEKLLEQYTDHDKPIYLAVDYQQLKSTTDSQKDTLNTLLDKEE